MKRSASAHWSGDLKVERSAARGKPRGYSVAADKQRREAMSGAFWLISVIAFAGALVLVAILRTGKVDD